MSLTIGSGPLGTSPGGTTNYTLGGPAHRILVEDHPRRMRAVLGSRTIFDTVGGRLLHESNLLPVLYVPIGDIDPDVLTRTDHTTHCPFKGDATYWTVTAGGKIAENAMWAYPGQSDRDASFVGGIDGYAAFYLDRMDEVYEEDERVLGHLRDPYHRVDVRPASRQVVVRLGDQVLAETDAPVAVFETGLPTRWYIPDEDVQAVLVDSPTTSVCAYKGVAAYRSLPDGPDDIAFSYPTALPEGQGLEGHWSFWGDGVTTEVTP